MRIARLWFVVAIVLAVLYRDIPPAEDLGSDVVPLPPLPPAPAFSSEQTGLVADFRASDYECDLFNTNWDFHWNHQLEILAGLSAGREELNFSPSAPGRSNSLARSSVAPGAKSSEGSGEGTR